MRPFQRTETALRKAEYYQFVGECDEKTNVGRQLANDWKLVIEVRRNVNVSYTWGMKVVQ